MKSRSPRRVASVGDRVEQRRRGVAGRRERPRRVGEALRSEVAQPAPRRLLGDRVEQRRRGVAGRREGPRRVGELLRREVAQPAPHRLLGDRVEQRRRGVAGRRVRPRRVGEGLRREVAQPAPRRLLGDRVEQRRRGVAGRRVRPRRVREVLRREVAQPAPRRLLGDRVEQRRLAPRHFREAVDGVGQMLRLHLRHTPCALRSQARPQRVARPPASGCMQARQAIDGVRQRAGVELGQRLLGVLRERLQHLWRSPQHLLLALLPHQLAQRVPRGAEVDGPVLLAVLRVGVDDLAHGAKLAYPRHARQAAPAGAAVQPRQAGAQQHIRRDRDLPPRR